jgi:hypothetical protein
MNLYTAEARAAWAGAQFCAKNKDYETAFSLLTQSAKRVGLLPESTETNMDIYRLLREADILEECAEELKKLTAAEKRLHLE